MLLHNYPPAVSLLKDTCPPGVFPAYLLSFPCGNVIQYTIEPGYVSCSGEIDSQILDFMSDILKFGILEYLGILFELFKSPDHLIIRMYLEEAGIVRYRAEGQFKIFGLKPADAVIYYS